jgi:hypothetical protein
MTFSSDCPICMESFCEEKNTLITECGHKFHTNCMMQNVAHNGFGCPYCRTEMVKNTTNIIEDDEDEEADSDYDPMNDAMIMEEDEYEDMDLTNYVLSGFRWFMLRVHGEELDNDEYGDFEEETDANEEDEEETINIDTAYVTNQMVSKGINMEDLVKVMLYDTTNRSLGMETEERYERLARRVHSTFRRIVNSLQ